MTESQDNQGGGVTAGGLFVGFPEGRSRGPLGRLRPHRGGQVLIIAMLGMGILSGLFFYVYNAGDQVSRRLEMQNAADAVAVSGANWMARSMNVVAMNNVEQARMLALVPVLDGLSLASDMSFDELDQWIGDSKYTPRAAPEGLTAAINGLQGNVGIDANSRGKILQGLTAIQQRMSRERELLVPIRNLRNTIESATYWSIRGQGGLPPHGRLWQAAAGLDELSQATVSSAGALAQADAVRFGRKDNATAAFMAPVLPSLPARRGTLQDFSPVLRQQLRVDLKAGVCKIENGDGGAIPDFVWPYRLGPWARLLYNPPTYPHPTWQHRQLGWRRAWGPAVPVGTPRTRTSPPSGGSSISGPSAGGGQGGSQASRGTPPNAGGTHTWQPKQMNVQGYTTFGPYAWAKSWVNSFANDPNVGLRDTRWLDYYNQIADTKLAYMFAANPALKVIDYPLWLTSLATARPVGDDPTKRKRWTRYYYIEVIYKGADETGEIVSSNLNNPVSRDYKGWVPPEDLLQQTFSAADLARITPLQPIAGLDMWKCTSTGIEKILNPDGSVKDQYPVYFVWYFIFGGLEAGGETQILNPCNWDPSERLPSPTLLDTSAGDYTPAADAGWRRAKFTYLGVARKADSARAWPTRFTSGNPNKSMVAMAQAEVFNNTSWDLWTQDWQAQLVPVTQWGDWMQRLQQGAAQAGQTQGFVQQNEVDSVHEYLSRIPVEAADAYLNH